MPARAWGCEHLTAVERVAKIINSGCHQLGGEKRPELLVDAVQQGLVPIDLVNECVAKLLAEKFELGLFDNPFIDPAVAEQVVGHPHFVRDGQVVQRRSITLLTNHNQTLPLCLAETRKRLIYVEGIDVDMLKEKYRLQIANSPASADIAILRLQAPFEPRKGGFESQFHAGSLEYDISEKQRQDAIFASVRTSIVDIYLDRPAVITEVLDKATAVVANYGSNSQALMDVLFGIEGAAPEGKLPFDLPSSMAAVTQSREDVPFDTAAPIL